MHKTPDTTLVVMNMTPAHTVFIFPPTKLNLFDAITFQLQSAILQRIPILLINDHDWSVSAELNCVHEFIVATLAGYQHKHFAYTQNSDRSATVIDICKALGFPRKRFPLCGTYTNLAIRDTAVSLAQALPDSIVDVQRTACTSTNPHEEFSDSFWNRFSAPNVVITPQPEIYPWSASEDNQPLRFVAKARDHNRRNYGDQISL